MILHQMKSKLLILAFATTGLAASTGNLQALASDDTQTLQNLILQSQGGTCNLPSKTFNVSATIFIPSNTKVVGVNEDTTVIKAVTGFQGTIIAFGTPVEHAASSNSSLLQVTVDGNATAYTGTSCSAGPAVYCPAGSQMITIANVQVRNDGLNGIGLHGLGTSKTAFAASVHDCFIHDNFADGINVAGTTPNKCGTLPGYVTKISPTLYNLVQRNALQNNDKALLGFHAINVGDLACFTTVWGNSLTKSSSSGTVDDNDISVSDNGTYDAYLQGFVQPPLMSQGNQVLSNTIDGITNPNGGHYDGIRVNGNELTVAIDGNSF